MYHRNEDFLNVYQSLQDNAVNPFSIYLEDSSTLNNSQSYSSNKENLQNEVTSDVDISSLKKKVKYQPLYSFQINQIEIQKRTVSYVPTVLFENPFLRPVFF